MESFEVALVVFAAVVTLVIATRIVTRVVDRRRIRHLSRYRGWSRIWIERGPSDRWGLWRRGRRCYLVRYFDEFGVLQSQECSIGPRFTVLWAD